MRTSLKAILLAAALLLPAACGDDAEQATRPPPQPVTETAIAHFCNMLVVEHTGPKGQILLKSQPGEPVWFASVRDTLAHTMLPEEPKDYAAVYVTDLARSADLDHPDLGAWVEAHEAWFVVGSRRTGGMGEAEIFPFGDEHGAHSFAAANGGKVTRFADVPRDAVIGGQSPAPVAEDHSEAGHGRH